jgi:hypothetical protein
LHSLRDQSFALKFILTSASFDIASPIRTVADNVSVGLCLPRSGLLKGDCQMDMTQLSGDFKVSMASGGRATLARICEAKGIWSQNPILNPAFFEDDKTRTNHRN